MRLLPAHDDNLQLGWVVIDQECDLPVDVQPLDEVKVVEDERQRFGLRGKVVDQARQQGLARGRFRRLEHCRRVRSDPGRATSNGRKEIGEET